MGRCLFPIVLLALVFVGAVGAAVPPPRRDLAEVRAVLAQAPPAPPARSLRPLNVLLVANRKDHGHHEHDYPRWMERWKVLLDGSRPPGSASPTLFGLTADHPAGPNPGAPRVQVETAVDWPTAEQLRRADVVVAFMGTGGIWNEAKLRDLRALLNRGAGFVALHAAVIAEKPHAEPLAELLGLAWESGHTLFRHGPLDLEIADRQHPITRGLPERIHFVDETYWPLIGDASHVQVLATAAEPERGTGRLAPQPMFWTHAVGEGRVFNSILGHYTWTFDDPYFRILVLRGIAWAAGESPYRFDPLVLAGARTTDRKPVVSEEPKAEPVVQIAPEAGDPNLLLWLDASDAATVTATADGRVSAWASKAAGVPMLLTSTGTQQPAYAAQGLGGRPAVRFDGVDDVLRSTAFRQASREWTIALVVTPRSNAGLFRAMLAANRPAEDDFQSGLNIDLGPSGTPAFSSINLEGIQGGGATNLRTGAAPFGAGQVLVLSAGGGSARLWVNGQQEEGRGASNAVTAMEELRLGGRFYMGQERGFFHGDISEVMIYRTRLSDTHLAGLTAHLIQKYGPDIQPAVSVVLDPWDYLPAYEWSATRRPLAPIDDLVVRARTDRRVRRALETRLIEVLEDDANTPAARDFAIRRLAAIGTAASVPVLVKLLGDPALTTLACFALERIPGGAADRALLDALPRISPVPRVQVINTLGSRRSSAAVPALTRTLGDADPAVRRASIVALGHIGGPAAVSALLAAHDRIDPSEQTAVSEALLQCADQLDAGGRPGEAERLYDRLARPQVPGHVRRAAARATIVRRGAAGVPLLVDQLNGDDAQAQAMALLLIRDLDGVGVTTAIASRLSTLTPGARVRAITALADRGDPAAAPGIRTVPDGEHSGVRLAILRALGRLGDHSDLPRLLSAAAADDPELAAVARGSLASLPGTGADAVLLRLVEQGDAATRAVAIEALGRRGHAPSTPALVRAAGGTEPSLRRAAFRALGDTAAASDVPALVHLLARTTDPGEILAAERALTTVYARIHEKERWAEALLAGLDQAGSGAKAALLRALSLHGGARTLRAVNAAVGDADPDLQAEALNLLVQWESADAAGDLLLIARTAANPTHRTLALRGFIRMAGLPEVAPSRRLEMCREGLRLSGRDDERRLVLAILPGAPSVEALDMALPFLGQEGLAEEAGAAAVAIAPALVLNHPRAVIEAMDRVRTSVKNEDLLRQAADLRARAEQTGR
jgi:HEAT repeat protein/type 1 glutamine amidotransferase